MVGGIEQTNGICEAFGCIQATERRKSNMGNFGPPEKVFAK